MLHWIVLYHLVVVMPNEVISCKLPSATSNKLSVENLRLLEETSGHESGFRTGNGNWHRGEKEPLLLVLIDGLGLDIAGW